MQLVRSLIGVLLVLPGFILPASDGASIRAELEKLTSRTIVRANQTSQSLSALELVYVAKVSDLPLGSVFQRFLRPPAESPEAGRDALLELLGHGLYIREAAAEARREGYVLPPSSEKIWRDGRHARISQALRSRAEEQVTTVSPELREMLEPRIPAPKATPEARDVSYIFRLVKPGTPDEVKNQIRESMEQARARIVGGQPFARVARQVSEAPSAPAGGAIGWIDRECGMNPRFLDLVFSTPERSISPVTELHNGYYLVMVTQVRPARTLEEDMQRAEEELLSAARDYWMDRYQRSAEKAHPDAPNPAEAVLLQMIADGWMSKDLEVDLKIWDDHCLAVSRFDARRKGTGVDEPSDEEVRAEYDNNPMPYAKFGFWMLTRYLVPVGSSESKVGSREEAVKRAEDARKRALEGMSDADIGRIFGQRYGLVIDSTEDWTRTSDQGLADRELIKTPVGGFTSVYSHDGGAMFYRKDQERPIERRPFEEVEEQIRSGKRAGNRDAAFWKVRREAVEARMADVDWDELRRWAEEVVPRP